MEINYRKNKNIELFDKIKSEEFLNLENPQNYIPLYERFFNFNETNYNSINLNNVYKLETLTEKIGYSKFNGIIVDSSNNNINKKIFFKYSPLVDPTKYMIGKYNTEDSSFNILNLPNFLNKEDKTINNKVFDPNNSAYSDGFFSYLSSLLLNYYGFLNGIDYYGSFLAIKNDFLVEIDEDLEYLDDSDYFHQNLNKRFKIIETEHTKNIFANTKKCKQKININNENIDLITEELFITSEPVQEDKQEVEIENMDIENNEILLEELDEKLFKLDDLVELNENKKTDETKKTDLTQETDETKNTDEKYKKHKRTNDLDSVNSSCSSRYSNTESSNEENSDNEDSSEENSSSTSESSCEEEIFATIDKFPVQTIALECCEDTLDDYIINNKIKDPEYESIVLQILFMLITYQKVFDFTHNDLHTNNIVYNKTEKKFLYYKFNNAHYKVPTFGKIYKIIDFGRAIYRFKGQLICSDSYAPEGDAATQYNCEPYFNENKARLEPNYSFDLCRLGCSLFDYFIQDIDDIKKLRSPIKKLMIEWVFDDKNKNILYKNDGEERYPDFKLYKMIARTVHNHTPQKVLKKEVFEKYQIARKKINNQSAIFNIDELPIMTQ
jgi:hypothetical protein